MKILVTGCAGFIGFHLCLKLLKNKNLKIFGIDNLNNYYDKKLKLLRLSIIKKNKNFYFTKLDIRKKNLLSNDFKKNNYDYVIHLAAQAGVRYSIENPTTYFENNLEGFFNILDNSRLRNVKHFLFASTSSVYGNNKKFPLKEDFKTEEPLSFYAATKKSNEVIAYSYSNIFNMPCTALRFFTAYGPYGRPDMSLFKFTKLITENKKIDLFNSGNHIRDFTYVDDIVRFIHKLIKKPSSKKIPYDVFNLASGSPNKLVKFLDVLEENLNIKSKKNNLSLQKGDVFKTHADIKKIIIKTGIKPNVDINKGIKNFVKWYKMYKNIK